MAPVVFLWVLASFVSRVTVIRGAWLLRLSAENSGTGNMHQQKQPLTVCRQRDLKFSRLVIETHMWSLFWSFPSPPLSVFRVWLLNINVLVRWCSYHWGQVFDLPFSLDSCAEEHQLSWLHSSAGVGCSRSPCSRDGSLAGWYPLYSERGRRTTAVLLGLMSLQHYHRPQL